MTEKNNYQDHKEVIAWLQEHFPKAFPRSSKLVKPFKVGIMDDIFDFCDRLDSQAFSKKRIRMAIAYYTSSPAYLLAQANRASRIDLFGEEIEPVSAEQAAYAKQKYEQRYKQKQHSKASK